MDPRGIVRFLRYSLVGGSTFAFDLLILWIMTGFMGVPYFVSTPLAFVIAVSINYFVSRRFVFKGTERKVHHGYVYFISLAGGTAVLITAMVALLIEAFALHYLIARVLVACVVGTANYLFNLHFNFKVAGRHH